MIVCHCAVVTDHEIRDAIHAGATGVCALAEVCGTSRACGGCLPAVREELAAHGLPTSDHLEAGDIRRILAERRIAVTVASSAS